MKTSVLLIFVMLLLKTVDSPANLRAPQNISRSPSSALYQLAKDARVLGEDMNVECDWQFCEVSVKYIIEVDRQLSASVDFMIPEEVDVAVKVGKSSVVVQKKSVSYGTDRREKDREVKQYPENFDALFQASFPVSLAQGKHEILINYRQPLSLEEVGYGYFSEGYFVGVFQYELWPLNEWDIAPDFRLDLNVNLKADLLNDWWDSLFNDASVNCFTTTFKQCDSGRGSVDEICRTVKPLDSSEDVGGLAVKHQFRAPLPDRLFCKISPE